MKMLRNNHYSKPLYRMIIFAWAVFIAVASLPFTASADAESEVVRVGYYENEVFQEGAREGDVKSGYAYGWSGVERRQGFDNRLPERHNGQRILLPC